MRGPRRFDWRSAESKKPPPSHGIKMKKAGTTWWGQRWIEALEQVLKGDAGRLSRGRTYARAGRTHDLVVTEGKVCAKVTGSRSTPYEITIALPQLDEQSWSKAIAGMAAQARFSAALLAGEMPQEIDEVFQSAGTSLFPKKRADLVTQCSCPDWGDPCKHVAATHYVLGEAFDRDPFLLFELRGKGKEHVLDALRAARGGATETQQKKQKGRAGAPEPAASESLEIPTIELGELKASEYDRPRGALPTLQFDFQEPKSHGAVLRQLGSPVGWQADVTAADALGPIIRKAAEQARRLALSDVSEATDTSSTSERSPSPALGAKPRKPAAPKPRQPKKRR